MIHSDWHIHSEFSYDASMSIETIGAEAAKQGLRFVGRQCILWDEIGIHVGVSDHDIWQSGMAFCNIY